MFKPQGAACICCTKTEQNPHQGVSLFVSVGCKKNVRGSVNLMSQQHAVGGYPTPK